MLDLILGGARSGKSNIAEERASTDGRDVIYLATAEPRDDEMSERIRRHKSERPSYWITIEEPIRVVEVIKASGKDKVILLECLTLWLSNALYGEYDFTQMKKEFLDFLSSNWLSDNNARLIIVSNEVGQGIIPMGKETRKFVDESGWIHQDIAKVATNVTFVVAGLEQKLKG